MLSKNRLKLIRKLSQKKFRQENNLFVLWGENPDNWQTQKDINAAINTTLGQELLSVCLKTTVFFSHCFARVSCYPCTGLLWLTSRPVHAPSRQVKWNNTF